MSDIDDNLMERDYEMENPVIIIEENPVITIEENPVIEENAHESDKEESNETNLDKKEKNSPPVRAPSAVWEHYKKIFSDDGIHIHTKCNYCNQKYAAKCSD